MSNSKRRCRHCKAYKYLEQGIVTPNKAFFCNWEHAISYANKKGIASQHAERKKAHRANKERLKTPTQHKNELQVIVNQYVRLRDKDKGCISCDKPSTWNGQWHCSHYISRGASDALRFNLWNMHKSCSVCNGHLSGNIEQYTPRLIKKIGQDKYDWIIRNKGNISSFDTEWIKRAKKIFRKKIKKLK